jgi:hypothetical protein
MLRSIDWQVNADLSEQPTCPIFKGQTYLSRNFCNSNQRCLTSLKNKYLKLAILISGVLFLLFFWNCLPNVRELNISWFRYIEWRVINYIDYTACTGRMCMNSELEGRWFGLFIGALAKLGETMSCLSIRLSVYIRPHGTTRLPLDGFSLKLIFGYFSKVCRDILSVIKSDNSNGHFTWRPMCIYYNISLSSSENKKCFRHIFREN